jgi:hypothetical protein
MFRDWLGLPHLEPSVWLGFKDVLCWLSNVVLSNDGKRKATASFVMLVNWKIWNERNARTFKYKSIMPTIIFSGIKL